MSRAAPSLPGSTAWHSCRWRSRSRRAGRSPRESRNRSVASTSMDELTAPKLKRIEYGVEQRLRELRDGGELSGLPGEGAPLPPDPDADAGDAWAARHIVRTARVRPVWAELRAEIGERRARILTRLRAHLAWVERREA